MRQNKSNSISLKNLSLAGKVRFVVSTALYSVVGVCIMFPIYVIGLLMTSFVEGYEKHVGGALARYQVNLWLQARKNAKINRKYPKSLRS